MKYLHAFENASSIVLLELLSRILMLAQVFGITLWNFHIAANSMYNTGIPEKNIQFEISKLFMNTSTYLLVIQ